MPRDCPVVVITNEIVRSIVVALYDELLQYVSYFLLLTIRYIVLFGETVIISDKFERNEIKSQGGVCSSY